ncbi:hypothetical protein ACO2Q8_07705 [Larkinella sp. VNQ87]|uniref:hypothetical protein n=1 Tax=Larkinella sp. VNQ87 TaxID=3400921 RepID=UPI003C00B7E7
MKCSVCLTEISNEEVSQFAAYGGLPSPCCITCFEANDFNVQSLEQLAAKSLLKRVESIIYGPRGSKELLYSNGPIADATVDINTITRADFINIPSAQWSMDPDYVNTKKG